MDKQEISSTSYTYGSFRRGFARITDLVLYDFLWKSVVYGILGVPLLLNWLEAFAAEFIPYMLMIFMEPILLGTWGTTPGKWLMGVQVQKINGGKLTFQEAVRRTFGVFFWGQGLNIPIFAPIRYILSFINARKGQQLPWEIHGKTYIINKRGWIFLIDFLLIASMIWGGVFFERAAIMPKHRGQLTVAEFAENYNRYVKYFLDSPDQLLNEDGKLVEQAKSPGTREIGSPGCFSDIRFTEEEGGITGVCLTADVKGEAWITNYQEMVVSAFLAFAASDERIYYRDIVNEDMFSLCGHNVYQQDFSFEINDIHISAQISHTGYESVSEDGLASSNAEGLEYHLIFEMKQ